MRRNFAIRMLAAAAFAGAVGIAPPEAEAQNLGQLFIEVMDAASGEPVTDLGPEAFRIEEDGRTGGVVSAEVGGAPMKIALMVDNGDAIAGSNAIADLRRALNAFLDTIDPVHEVGLFTIARQTRRRADFTFDRAELRDEVSGIFADQGGGSRVFDGVRDTWRRRFEDEEPFPVFVMVLTDGTEGSGFVTPGEFAELGQQLTANAVTIHAVQFSTRGGSAITSMATNLTQNTGGGFEVINASSALDDTLANLATRMNAHYERVSNWYRVLYERPDPPGTRLTAGVTARPGILFNLFIDRRMLQ